MSTSPTDLARLVDLVARLRAPDGCPWDRKQTLETVRAYLIEEAHEAAAAVAGGDWREIAAELGDLLFQVAFVTRLGEEAGALDRSQVVDGVVDKMIERHPHVFGSAEERLGSAEEVEAAWERRKLETAEEAAPTPSLLAGVPRSLPSLVAAYRMTQKAAGVGFDWPDAADVLAKLDEETAELRQALEGRAHERPAGERQREEIEEELGDVLFTVANLARKLGVDPDAALDRTNAKFRRRFGHVERRLAEDGPPLGEASLEEMDRLWDEAKEKEGA